MLSRWRSLHGRRKIGSELMITIDKNETIEARPKSGTRRAPTLQPLEVSFNMSSDCKMVHAVTPSSAHPITSSPITYNPENNQLDNSGDISSLAPYKNGPVEIVPGLFLGSEKNASSKLVLKRNQIKSVLNVGIECSNHHIIPGRENNDPASKTTYSHVHTFALSSNRSSSSSSLSTEMPLSPIYNPLNVPDCHTMSRLASEFQNRTHMKSSKTNLPQPEDANEDIDNEIHCDNCWQVERYMKLPWTHNEENIRSFFETAFRFIDHATANDSAVLVHCKQGVSRSATLVIAYVMKINGWTMSKAYEFVKIKSPCISPNLVFIYQLIEFERELFCDSASNN